MTSVRERVEALLVVEATGMLSAEESKELEELLRSNPDVDRYAFQRSAAAVFLAAVGLSSGTFPARLHSRIVADAESALEERD